MVDQAQTIHNNVAQWRRAGFEIQCCLEVHLGEGNARVKYQDEIPTVARLRMDHPFPSLRANVSIKPW